MTAAPDVYKRWLQFGLLSTHSRLHGSKSYRVPWLFDEEAVDVCRKFTKLKLRLLPYLYSMAVKSHRTGIPSMRAMIMEFNDDPATKYLDMQYMLGDSILVAPIFNKEGHAEYYLPAGRWTHLLSGEVKDGGRWYEEDYDFFSLPVFVRENTLLPIGAVDTTVDYELEKDVQIQVYELNGTSSCEIVTRTGESAFTVNAVKEGNKLTLETTKENPGMTYLLRNIHEVSAVKGGSVVKDTEDGIILAAESAKTKVTF
jgi:alpha-D-xyloside xylohydrolase